MTHISVTELRIKSSELVKALQNGDRVTLLFRSRVVGTIFPSKFSSDLVKSTNLSKYLKKISPSRTPLSRRKRENLFREHLAGRYG